MKVRCWALLLPCLLSWNMAVAVEDAPAPGGHLVDGEAHGEHQEINWFQGFLGENAEAEPGLLFRPPGTPAPFGSVVLNTALLLFLLVKVGGPKVSTGLKARRQTLLKGIEEASAMQKEAEGQLQAYRQRLEQLDEEIERVKREMREAAEAERQRVLAESKERRERMEREARALVKQELSALRQVLTQEAARAAIASAKELLAQGVTSEDDSRLSEQYLQQLDHLQTRAGGLS